MEEWQRIILKSAGFQAYLFLKKWKSWNNKKWGWRDKDNQNSLSLGSIRSWKNGATAYMVMSSVGAKKI